MDIAFKIVTALGGIAGLIALTVAVGRWAGRREGFDEKLPKEQAEARDETRRAVKRIEEEVSALSKETREGFAEINASLKPLFARHAQQEIVDRDLDSVVRESKETRERLIKLETQVSDLRANARPRSRKTGG